jgi:elongator complex protein 3
MDETRVCREIIARFFSLPEGERDIDRIKRWASRRFKLAAVPKNSLILAAATPDEREVLRRWFQVKPTRTLSGVAPIAVMTSPWPCPHGKCLPCPGGPDHPFQSPQSYTGEEPAAKRAREHHYDPYDQVHARLSQFEALGHHVDKAELIVMGGTITARPVSYQEEVVGACLEAMNAYPGLPDKRQVPDVAALASANEDARVRCIAITFETRPDWCRREQVDTMLGLGVTKVELGVQQIDDEILSCNRRGCDTGDTIEANTLLRDAGLKVGFHVMPNLPGSSPEKDRNMFERLFSDDRFRPDFLKIYPTLVTPGSEIEDLHKKGLYSPYEEKELVDLIAFGKSCLPEYVRLQRIQRDIPARLITAGSRHSNFRQLAASRLMEQGLSCRCIRCREIGRAPSGEKPALTTMEYSCCGGTEIFISAVAGDSLVGFARLRYPGKTWRPEVEGSALLRELHVYGAMVPLGSRPETGEHQHLSVGGDLLDTAEHLSVMRGYEHLAVMSGIGVRPYYRRHGYVRTGPYMKKRLG